MRSLLAVLIFVAGCGPSEQTVTCCECLAAAEGPAPLDGKCVFLAEGDSYESSFDECLLTMQEEEPAIAISCFAVTPAQADPPCASQCEGLLPRQTE